MAQVYKEDFTGDDLNIVLGLTGTLGKALAALKTDFSGPVEPTTGVESYSKWLDTSSATKIRLKIRNTANDDWSIVWEWDGTNNSPTPSGDQGLLFGLILS